MNLLRHLPNTITLGNLACGLFGIIVLFEAGPAAAAPLIILGAALDFMDGFAARALKAYSAIGKELDSLADMVTFGVLPSLMMMRMLEDTSMVQGSLSYVALLIAIFSALRLAKFNVDTEQAEHFIGLPTPACAILIASIAMGMSEGVLMGLFNNFSFLLILTLALSFLLVAPLPLFSLKFKSFGFGENKVRYIFLMCSMLILATMMYSGVPLIILLYVTLSIISPPKKASIKP